MKIMPFAVTLVLALVLSTRVVSAYDIVPATYWRLDDGLASSSASESIQGLRGSLNGGVSWSPAAVLLVNGSVLVWDLGRGRNDSAWALDFDGKSGYVEVEDAPVLRSGSFSVAFWASPDSSGDWDNVMGKQLYQNGEQSGWIICWDSSSPRMLRLLIYDQSHMESSSTGVPMTVGEWAHIVFTVGDGSICAYKNGVSLGQTVLRGYEPISEPFRIGKAYGNGHYYDGLIDDVRFYDWSLLAGEVSFLYADCGYNNPGSDQVSTDIEEVEVSFTPGVENRLGVRLLDQRGRVLVGVPLSFTLDDVAIGTGTTDSHGVAWIPYMPVDSNTRTLTAVFNGAEGFTRAYSTVQLAAAAQTAPLQQYVIIVAVAAAAVGAAIVLLKHRRRRTSDDLADSLREVLGEFDHKYY